MKNSIILGYACARALVHTHYIPLHLSTLPADFVKTVWVPAILYTCIMYICIIYSAHTKEESEDSAANATIGPRDVKYLYVNYTPYKYNKHLHRKRGRRRAL